jgi:hypothetical protein
MSEGTRERRRTPHHQRVEKEPGTGAAASRSIAFRQKSDGGIIVPHLQRAIPRQRKCSSVLRNAVMSEGQEVGWCVFEQPDIPLTP